MNTGLERYPVKGANVFVPHILCAVYFGRSGDGFSQEFEEACDQIGLHQFGQPSDEDTDLGPYEAWGTENVGFGMYESFIPEIKVWLRERAYVLWDSDRVRKMGVLKNEDEGGI